MIRKKKSQYRITGMQSVPLHMRWIINDMTSRCLYTFVGEGDGPYRLVGGNRGPHMPFYKGDEVVVLSSGAGNDAENNLSLYEKVQVVGVRHRNWASETDLLVLKDNGTVVIMKSPFIVVTVREYMDMWISVNGWDHWNPETLRPEGRCPAYN